MKILVTILIIIAFNLQFDQKNENTLEGVWFAKELENSIIEITKNNKNIWAGKIIASDDKKIIGRIVFDNIKSDNNGNWVGKLTDPKKEIEVDAKFNLENPNKLKLVGKKFFFTKTFYWVRKNLNN